MSSWAIQQSGGGTVPPFAARDQLPGSISNCPDGSRPSLQMRREGGQTVVSPGATQAHMTQLVLPQHANSLAITFGGVVC